MLQFHSQMMKYGDHIETPLSADAAAGVHAVDSPPSYSEAMKNPGTHDRPASIWTTPLRPVSKVDADVDKNVEPFGALGGMARSSPSGGLGKRASAGGLSFSPTHETASPFSNPRFSDSSTQRKREFRNWNPPMLGNLPDDFLRIMSPSSPCANSDFERLSNLTASPVNVMSLTDARPKIHKPRGKSEKMSRSFSMGTKEGSERELKPKNSDRRSKSGETIVRSFSVADESTRSKGARHKDRRHQSPAHRSVVRRFFYIFCRIFCQFMNG